MKYGNNIVEDMHNKTCSDIAEDELFGFVLYPMSSADIGLYTFARLHSIIFESVIGLNNTDSVCQHTQTVAQFNPYQHRILFIFRV